MTTYRMLNDTTQSKCIWMCSSANTTGIYTVHVHTPDSVHYIAEVDEAESTSETIQPVFAMEP